MQFFSHPDKLLIKHLEEVGNKAGDFTDTTLLPKKIAYITGVAHDFGKYTTFFQEHLLNRKNEGAKGNHSFISALFAYSLLKNDHFDSDIVKYLPFIAFFAILHHHGDLTNMERFPSKNQLKSERFRAVADLGIREQLLVLNEQLNDMRNHEEIIESEYKKIGIDCDLNSFSKNTLNYMEQIAKDKYFLENKEDKLIKEKVLIALYLLYSVLIDADKREAGKVEFFQRKSLDSDLVDRYRRKHFDLNSKDKINILRNVIYQEVVEKAHTVSSEKHFFTITAPTGTGKTLTSLAFALKFRERIRKEKGYTPRIIYSLPFISIIDQNYEVFRKVLREGIKDFDANESLYIIPHHHLSSIKYKIANDNKPVDESLLLIESWESEVIVSTFVQLLHTLIGFKNGFLKKFHNLQGSIILLDEVQNIPIEYWDITQRTFELVAKYIGSYIVLLTATKALIFKENDAIELVPNTKEYFSSLNRTALCAKDDIQDIDTLSQWFEENYDKFHSYLLVMNTINSSIKLYNKIKELFHERILPFDGRKDKESFIRKLSEKIPLFYLSSNIVPKERKKRIDIITSLIDKKIKPILVSTQVIEAGVDFDFDTVVRDVAPIDSILQAIGRCNRNGQRSLGKAYIVQIDHLAGLVYGKISPNISKEMLKKQNIIEEKMFFPLINTFFSDFKNRANTDKSINIYHAMMDFSFFTKEGFSVSDFKLIDEEFKENVLVEIDEEAQKIWNEFEQRVLLEKDYKKRRNEYLNLRQAFNFYCISISQRCRNLPPKKNGRRIVPNVQLNEYYDLETGFITKGINPIW